MRWYPWLKLSKSILFVSAILGLSYFLFATQSGLQSVVWIIQKIIPVELKIANAQGRLLGPFALQNVFYQNKDIEISIPQMQVEWKLKQVTKGFLSIKNITLDDAKLIIKATDEKTESNFSWPKWLSYVRLESLHINQLNIDYLGNKLQLQGDMTEQWNMKWNLQINNLKNLYSNLQGKLILTGDVTGERLNPELHVLLDQGKINFNHWDVNSIKGMMTIKADKQLSWSVHFNAPLIKNKQTLIQPFNLQATGALKPFSLQAQLSPVTIRHVAEGGDVLRFAFPATQLKIISFKQGLQANLFWPKLREVALTANAFLPNYQADKLPSKNQPIQAEAHFVLRQIGVLDLLLPKIKNLQGLFKADANISGTLFAPQLTGEILVQSASGLVPSLNLQLKEIQLQVKLIKKEINWIGRVRSGEGYLQLKGLTQYKDKKLPTLFDITGDNITVSNTRNYKIIATPKLQIKASTQRIDIKGVVFLPHAKFKFGAEDENIVELSKDVVFTDAKKKPSFELPFYSDIQIRFGDDIKFSYEGLKTKLEGQLALKDEPGRPTLASGQLNLVGGEYKYYNQILKVQPGSYVLFPGSVADNPNLNITVSKQVKLAPATNSNVPPSPGNVPTSATPSIFSTFNQSFSSAESEVGVRVRGTAQNPQMSLFANPATLNQMDILSYILTGQPSGQLSAASAQLLFNAASGLGGKNSDLTQLVQSLQKGVGLDELSVQASPIMSSTGGLEQNTSLVIGKALSPRLYVSYSLGILKPISILQMSYLLNKYFTVQTTASTYGNGVDLLFKKEN